MKTMTCKQLGGACDLEFHADSFEEIAEMSKIKITQTRSKIAWNRNVQKW